MREFGPIGKTHDIEEEATNKEPVYLEGMDVTVYAGKPDPRKLLAIRRRIAAEGRVRFKELREFMTDVLHLSESTANQALNSVAVAQFEYSDKGWYKLYDDELAESTRKSLFADFVKLAQWWAHRKPRDAQEREQLDELIDALTSCQFWHGDRAGLLARHFQNVDVEALISVESSGAADAHDEAESVSASIDDEEPVAPVPPSGQKKKRGRKPKVEQPAPSLGMASEIERLMASAGTRDPKLIMLSTERAARLLGYTPTTLRRWRHRNEGPHYTRLGNNDRCQAAYCLADILEWLEKRKFCSTSEESARRTQDLLTGDRETAQKSPVRRRDDGKRDKEKALKKKPRKPQ